MFVTHRATTAKLSRFQLAPLIWQGRATIPKSSGKLSRQRARRFVRSMNPTRRAQRLRMRLLSPSSNVKRSSATNRISNSSLKVRPRRITRWLIYLSPETTGRKPSPMQSARSQKSHTILQANREQDTCWSASARGNGEGGSREIQNPTLRHTWNIGRLESHVLAPGAGERKRP